MTPADQLLDQLFTFVTYAGVALLVIVIALAMFAPSDTDPRERR